MELDASAPTQPHSLSNMHHRKIELQSPLDLTYLQAKLSQCAQQKLDLHFPHTAAAAAATNATPAEFISLGGPRAVKSTTAATDASTSTQPQPSIHSQQRREERREDGEERREDGEERREDGEERREGREERREDEEEADPLRTHVHALLTAFLSRTWANALPSVSINGLDAHASLVPDPCVPATTTQGRGQSGQREEIEGIDYTYTAFDGKLQQRVASLYAEVEALTAQVSRLRREAPARGAAAYADALKGMMERDDNDDVGQQQDGDIVAKAGLQLEGLRSGWHDDVESMYERGVDGLVRLAGLKGSDGGDGSLTETVGKVQRARSVAMEFG
ncbi:hypothetical protein DV737_g860, partial [Chaetothyriales sp. CBS 132003]